MTNEQRKKLLDHIARNGLNITRQRMKIADIFLDIPGHSTLDDAYAAVSAIDPSIGQATVYRTLKLLCDAGLVRELHFSNEKARYESANATVHHDHLLCEKCGKLTEFIDPDIEERQMRIAEENGYKLIGHTQLLIGICPECQKKED